MMGIYCFIYSISLIHKMDIKQQLQQDIANFDKQIKLLDTQIKQLIGAKMYAKKLLERIEKEGKEK